MSRLLSYVFVVEITIISFLFLAFVLVLLPILLRFRLPSFLPLSFPSPSFHFLPPFRRLFELSTGKLWVVAGRRIFSPLVKILTWLVLWRWRCLPVRGRCLFIQMLFLWSHVCGSQSHLPFSADCRW